MNNLLWIWLNWLTWFWLMTLCQPFDLDTTPTSIHLNDSKKYYSSNKPSYNHKKANKKQRPVIKIKNVNIYFVDKLSVNLGNEEDSSRASDNDFLESSTNESSISSRSRMDSIISSLFPLTRDQKGLKSIEAKKDPELKSIDGARSKLFPGFGSDLDKQDSISTKDRNDLARDVTPYDSKDIRVDLGQNVDPHYSDSLNTNPSDRSVNSKSRRMFYQVKDFIRSRLTSVTSAIEKKFPETFVKMKKVLLKFSDVTQKGAELAMEGIALAFKEVKSSELINKLELQLEQVNEIVKEFFQRVGEKVALWSKSKQRNSGKLQHDSLLTRIFQDPKIQECLSRMTSEGILSQDQVKILRQYYKRSPIIKLHGA